MFKLQTSQMIFVAVLVVVVGAAGFFGGIKFQQSKTASLAQSRLSQGGGQGQNGGQNRGFRGGASGGGVLGEILGQDDKSITVKLADGSTKIVLLSDSTTYNKAAAGAKSDLKVGDRVSAFGTPNSDGSITAQNVQLNPIMRGTGGGMPTMMPNQGTNY